MFILNTVKPEEATGKVAEAYGVFPKEIPVPDPLVLMSASPQLLHLQSQVVRHYMTHDKLDMGLLAMIRYLAAVNEDYTFCINLNAGILKMAGGFSDEDLKALQANPENAPIDESQKALLLFVLKVIKRPGDVTAEEVDKLRQMGWRDQDIFDAAYHGAAMIGAGRLFRAFSR